MQEGRSRILPRLADKNSCRQERQFATRSLDVSPTAHYQFEAIHPFTDGNGRTGRVLNSLFVVEQGLLPLPILYLNRCIIAH